MKSSIKYESLAISNSPLIMMKFVNHNSNYRVHWHEEIEILYFTEGEGKVICNMNEYVVRRGDIIIANGNEIHTGCSGGFSTVYYCFQIKTGFFHNIIGNEYVAFINVIKDYKCRELLENVISKYGKGDYESLISLKKNLYDFFSLIISRYVRSVLSEAEYKKQFKRLDRFNSMIEYVEEHYNENLSVDALAKQFFMSSSYFAHLFKRKAGKSVIKYLNELRIRHAKSLLEIEDSSIGEIAYTVGFNDINYFSRSFKMLEGVSPGEYRKLYLKNKT